KGQNPPVKGFWSLTLYDEEHFFYPNPLNRYSLGTKNKNLKYEADGSLVLYVGAKSPGKEPAMQIFAGGYPTAEATQRLKEELLFQAAHPRSGRDSTSHSMDDTPEDHNAVQPVISRINFYRSRSLSSRYQSDCRASSTISGGG